MTDEPPRQAKRHHRAKSKDELYVRLQVTLPPDLAAQARAYPEGVSAALARLLRQDKQRS